MTAYFITPHIDTEFLCRLVMHTFAKHGNQIPSSVQLLVESPHFCFDRIETHRSIAMRVKPGLHDLTHRLANGYWLLVYNDTTSGRRSLATPV